MQIELSENEFRLLIDLVYTGNWVLNSVRELGDRIAEYDMVESRILSHCVGTKFDALITAAKNGYSVSRAFEDGGIHEAIAEYEDAVFFDILAEDLALRDMEVEGLDPADSAELMRRTDEYLEEFEQNGLENITLDIK